MSKQLWIKKLGIPACIAGIATGAFAWTITGQGGSSALQKTVSPASAGMPACCEAPPKANLGETDPLAAPLTVSAEAGAEPAVCPLGYGADKSKSEAESDPAVCPLGYGAEPVKSAETPASQPNAPESANVPMGKDSNADARPHSQPRYRLLGLVAQNDAGAATVGETSAESALSLSGSAPTDGSDVDALIDGISLPEYQGKNQVFEKVAPRMEEMKAAETQAAAEEESFIHEPLFPPLEQPLVSVEDYQKRLEVVEGIGREMAETANRVNNTAGQWKTAHDNLKIRADAMAKEIEELKSKNRQLLIEKGELMKKPAASAKSSPPQAKNLNKPLLNITEKDLGLPARPDVKEQLRAAAPPPAPTRPAAPVAAAPAPRVVQAPDGTRYEGPVAPTRREGPPPANVPVAKAKPAPRNQPVASTNAALNAPALNNLPAPFPGSQQPGAPRQAQATNPALKPASPEELEDYHRWQRENNRPAAPSPAPAPAPTQRAAKPSAPTANSTAVSGEKRWEWDPVTGNIRRVNQ